MHGLLLCDAVTCVVKLHIVLQDVLLLDSLRGSWDSNNQALYYGYLLSNSTNRITAGPGVCGSLLPHQRQELDIAYK